MKAPRIASLVAAAVMMAAGQPAAAATKHDLLAKLDAATQGSLVSTAHPMSGISRFRRPISVF